MKPDMEIPGAPIMTRAQSPQHCTAVPRLQLGKYLPDELDGGRPAHVEHAFGEVRPQPNMAAQAESPFLFTVRRGSTGQNTFNCRFDQYDVRNVVHSIGPEKPGLADILQDQIPNLAVCEFAFFLGKQVPNLGHRLETGRMRGDIFPCPFNQIHGVRPGFPRGNPN
ncbi:hypothetical protein [Hyphobacterium marinum]|uniref:Uncharacterized protein n=1 Tax=Hyphobacterium marinum TaxID=3116574 RepID=A0ABU7LVA6_9PROT|nr:hypothetical protein [Hyphobacterium sp. Y6023]MEE2565105.1 hypothetical protein [Hyphobacterium sp. Y6023]